MLVQQALDTSKSSTTGVAVIQNNLQQSLRDMEAKVQTPIAGLSTRLDGMDQDLRTLQQSVSDLNSSMNKLQQQLTDLNHAVSILQAPAPPPPGSGTNTTGRRGSRRGFILAVRPFTGAAIPMRVRIMPAIPTVIRRFTTVRTIWWAGTITGGKCGNHLI